MAMDDHERVLRQRAKALMRKRFKSHRGSLPRAAVVARSAALCERLLASEELGRARHVALFWPIERFNEVDLRSVDAALRERAVVLAYPCIPVETREMTFRRVNDPSELSLCELGFMAPPESAPVVEPLDVVVVPGLAFDPRGYRIGYGGGFYDQALARVRPPAIALGVAFDFQLAADVPFSERDVPVDIVMTDRRRLDAER